MRLHKVNEILSLVQTFGRRDRGFGLGFAGMAAAIGVDQAVQKRIGDPYLKRGRACVCRACRLLKAERKSSDRLEHYCWWVGPSRLLMGANPFWGICDHGAFCQHRRRRQKVAGEYLVAEPLDYFHFAEAPDWFYGLVLQPDPETRPAASVRENVAHPSKRKGSDFELEEVRVLQGYAIDAVKIPGIGGRLRRRHGRGADNARYLD